MRPNIHLQTESVTIWHGDSIDTMRELPDNSIDSIVTDPPYGLGFMGKAWDALPPGEEWAAECLRVLKPGGHLLAFGGSRTWHRLAVAVEDAGFEIRDSIAWLYGSGFPKSLDVSKAIDKARTEDLEPAAAVARAVVAAMAAKGITRADVNRHFGFSTAGSGAAQQWTTTRIDRAIKPRVPVWEQWQTLTALLELHDEALNAEVWRLNGRKGTPGEAWAERPDADYAGGVGMAQSWTDGKGWNGNAAKGGTGVTEAAQEWQGWGTALKPAFEPVVVGRKPLIGTVAQNVQQYGTGALNIDATRIAGEPVAAHRQTEGEKVALGKGWGDGYQQGDAAATPMNSAGRWPANVVLDADMAEVLDGQSGTSKSTAGGGLRSAKRAQDGTGRPDGYRMAGDQAMPGYDDQGGASRFFYVAKAPKRERPVVDGVTHPTVKPLALMRWLVKLVTPPGGVVLDPFEGSGTTLEACLLEGFDHVGIEREQDYLPLIAARLDRQAGTLPAAA